jgi:hypothetical protein
MENFAYIEPKSPKEAAALLTKFKNKDAVGFGSRTCPSPRRKFGWR